jgi:hypothetical protein
MTAGYKRLLFPIYKQKSYVNFVTAKVNQVGPQLKYFLNEKVYLR